MPFPPSTITDRFFRYRRHCGDITSSASSSLSSPAHWNGYSLSQTGSRSNLPSDSRMSTSSSLRIRALLIQVKMTYGLSRTYAARCFDNKGDDTKFPADIKDPLPEFPGGGQNSESPSSWPAHSSCECECTSRSTCPYFIQQHLNYLQNHEWRHVPGTLIPAYHVSADEYAHASNALSLPSAKLARARAEHDFITHRSNGARLWAPRFHEQLLAAEEKIAAAEKDWEAANIRRWERAQLLVDIGRF